MSAMNLTLGEERNHPNVFIEKGDIESELQGMKFQPRRRLTECGSDRPTRQDFGVCYLDKYF